LYTGSLARRLGRLKLLIGSRGDSLIHLQATVQVRCQKGKPQRIQIVSLSTTNYGVIARNGTFQIRLSKQVKRLRKPQVQLGGTFNVAGRRAKGTIRITGTVPGGGRCDSGPVTWTARVA
jgi:hypothetical protein